MEPPQEKDPGLNKNREPGEEQIRNYEETMKDAPPFQGYTWLKPDAESSDSPIDGEDTPNPALENDPNYAPEKSELKITPEDALKYQFLGEMDPERLKKIIDVSGKISKIPGAAISGGNATRLLVLSLGIKNGTTFGPGKDDFDAEVPSEVLMSIYQNGGIDGWVLNSETDEHGESRWNHPERGRIAINLAEEVSGQHLDSNGLPILPEQTDLFANDNMGEPILIEVNGVPIRVQNLTDQILSKLRMKQRGDFERLGQYGKDRYGIYSQYILECADRAPELLDLDRLPEDWHENLESIAHQGRFDKDQDTAEIAAIQTMIESQKHLQEKIRQLKRQMIEDLKQYYEASRTENNTPELKGLATILEDDQDKVDEICRSSSSPDDFISNLLSNLPQDTLDTVKASLEELAKTSV